MDPIIISVAPNGARKTKENHPNIPFTADEIATEATSCMEAGAALMHMHIRNDKGGHTLDSARYLATTKAVREAVGEKLIIQVTSEAVGMYTPNEQMQMVREVKPESVSLAIREIIPDPSHENTAKDFLSWVYEQGILPQYILYNTQEVAYFADLRKRGIVPGDKVFVLFVLGRRKEAVDPLTSYSQPEDLDEYLECFEHEIVRLKDTVWSVAAFGGNEQACVHYAAQCGGHPRIGFENNHLMAQGGAAPHNGALIRQFIDLYEGPRSIASAKEARALLCT